MPKKKGKKHNPNQDFTLNDCANALKPVSRPKKVSEVIVLELSWEEIDEDNLDIVEETDANGDKTIVYKKKRHFKKSTSKTGTGTGTVYPEIIWYLISKYIRPEDVGRFAGINKAAYAVTKRESFWRGLYNKYCKGNDLLPRKLRIENSYKSYGLRQRVIRGLYHTRETFCNRALINESQARPYDLVKWRCINVFYEKRHLFWCVNFKFKKFSSLDRRHMESDFLKELERVDANPEENSKVLHLLCPSVTVNIEETIGMFVSKVQVAISQNFRQHTIVLSFTDSPHSDSVLPHRVVKLNFYRSMILVDWWHPKYPYYDNHAPSMGKDDVPLVILKKDFFSNTCEQET